jgi:uncharacterized protein (DUF1810 family)
MTDQFNLKRFVDAQDSVYEAARSELLQGQKSGHWMWFIFPQLAGLGHSFMAEKYAISSLDEARAFVAHPLLGARLKDCTQIVIAFENRPIHQIFGHPDALKFRSSMTLFAHAAPEEGVFRQALKKYFKSESDPLTVERL